ncbi:HlyD family efflux transporter periplasmic adaptor subunit [Halomonas sp. GFAJ-1]|uniref:HlyD family efflux transporter periplasmic adaptor subunit n=1 Tax=Halomonas sp. GFAJ-1 TaxID=1118153 RepID=UPI00023A469B|nr:HlyD family efflux transporter periplasmic adaptor subunit [Halomonas sp. GFAJ-1]AVI62949.1 peptidase M50 [Halomonas sp. GFAJ-1]EHK61987.1 M50 family peptidase [Halomonas sp. GFAJ-1]
MSASLYSDQWHRVSHLAPRLRKHTSIHRHDYRGAPWYVLFDALTGQAHRFTPEAYQVIGRLDGSSTLQSIWDDVSYEIGDEMPTQDELIGLIAKLHHANILAGYHDIDIEELSQRRRQGRLKKIKQVLRSPLGVKIPLVDPDAFINATYPYVRPFLSIWGALIWIAVIGFAVVLAAMHWGALTDNLADRVLGLNNLLLMALVYPVIKVIHELGHAWTTKDTGGEVHEIGVMFLVFFPVPYVDASAAAVCPEKRQRMLVGAAGILVELFIAALAMMVWLLAEPGLLRSIMFNIMVIAGISTLLFNGNPLLRFDAYYVLSDWLEIPNFGQRANQQLGYLIKRFLLKKRDTTSSADSPKESFWLVLYAVTSFIYRMFLMVFIAIFVATSYFFIGVILAIWSLYMALILPSLKILKEMVVGTQLEGYKMRAWLWLVSVLLAIVAVLFLIPLPHSSVVHGVVDSREPTNVRVGASGELRQWWVEDGERVEEGQLMADLYAPELTSEVARLEGQRREAEFRMQATVRNPQAIAIERENLSLIENRLADAQLRAAGTRVVSPRNGQVNLDQERIDLGQFIPRGQTIGTVIQDSDLRIRSLLPGHLQPLIVNDLQEVKLKLPGHNREFESALLGISPSATRDIPSITLTRQGGGQVALDPEQAQELIAYRQHYTLDVDASSLIDAETHLALDSRVFIKLIHTPSPIGFRLWDNIRRNFLSLFDR